MKEKAIVGGYLPGCASWAVTLLFLALDLLRLFAPFIWSLNAPTAGDLNREAPLVGAVAVVLLALLGISIWHDSQRDSRPLGIAAGLIALNVAVRGSFNINLGVEFNYVLPFIVGLAAGGPLGFFVGAASCLASQFLADQISTPLTGQMLVWGLAGIVGGLLRPLGPRLSCLVAPVAGLGFGIGAGILLNAIGWPTATDADPRFIAAMPFDVNFASLVEYEQRTSSGVDLLRGITTAIGLAVFGYPLSRALRQALRPPLVDSSPVLPDPNEPDPDAVQRRRRARAATDWERDTDE